MNITWSAPPWFCGPLISISNTEWDIPGFCTSLVLLRADLASLRLSIPPYTRHPQSPIS